MLKDKEKEVIDRGYMLDDEYDEFISKYGTEKFRILKDEDNCPESFWGIKLVSDPNKMVLANDLLAFIGLPRSCVGMVAYHDNNIVDLKKSFGMFKATGNASINYWRSVTCRRGSKEKK